MDSDRTANKFRLVIMKTLHDKICDFNCNQYTKNDFTIRHYEFQDYFRIDFEDIEKFAIGVFCVKIPFHIAYQVYYTRKYNRLL